MILGIDAFNLSSGGGITHLVELLRAASPWQHGFERVIIWGAAKTLAKVESREWLQKMNEPLLDRGLPYRVFWHRFLENKRARQAGCDILFLPGGTVSSGFAPTVAMCRNMLPFEWRELRRYGWSRTTLKLTLLRWTQARSFQNADGIIFLTRYARDMITNTVGVKTQQTVIIPHGVSARFFRRPTAQHRSEFTPDNPCRIVYVSIVSPYKHQWVVVEAIGKLRAEGIPVALELIGPPAEGICLLKDAIRRVDPHRKFISYRGAVPYEAVEKCYANADIGLFASSCENMPNILLEGMAAGLPIACSHMGPMPEVLGDAGEYFNPLDSGDIAKALSRLIESPKLRGKQAQKAYERARDYSWERCANDTFEFLAKIATK